MQAQDLAAAITLIFIFGMIWLRTRMFYVSRRAALALTLQPAGRWYFAAALAVLALGWLAAPPLGHAIWPLPLVTPTVSRVAWDLLSYYLFILVHRGLQSRGIAVFAAPN
jgi:hypothetical protein